MAPAPIRLDGWTLDGKVYKVYGSWVTIVICQTTKTTAGPEVRLEVGETSPLGPLSISIGFGISMQHAEYIGQTMAAALDEISNLVNGTNANDPPLLRTEENIQNLIDAGNGVGKV